MKALAFYLTHIILWKVLGPLLLRGAVVPPLLSLVAVGSLTAFWVYNMVDARRGTEGQGWSPFSPTLELLALAVLGLIVIVLLGIPFIFQETTAR